MKTFTQKVYEVVQKIPKGKVLTYKEVARRAGSPRATRAVGTALSKNYNTTIPCHRVIKSNGSLGEYNRGVKQKMAILQKEGALNIYTMKKGFTLIEVMVVITILGILAAIILFNITEARQKGRNGARINDMQKIAKAIDAYVVEHNKLPPLPAGSDSVRPGISSTDLEEYDPEMPNQQKFGWNEFMETIGLGPIRDPLNGRQVPGAANSNNGLMVYNYVVGFGPWTYDPTPIDGIDDYLNYGGAYHLPMVYARLEGGPRAGTVVCEGGASQPGPYVGSGYGSTNCMDLNNGCSPAAAFGEDPWICIPTGYSGVRNVGDDSQ